MRRRAPSWRGSRKAPGDCGPRASAAAPRATRPARARRSARSIPSTSSPSAAAGGRSAAGDLRHRSEIVEMGAARGHQPHRTHDPAPVPPALGQARILAAVDHDHQLVRCGRAAARAPRSVNGVYGSTLRPSRRPLRKTVAVRRTSSNRISQRKPRGRWRAREAEAVAAHLAGVLRGDCGAVEHARHGDRAPVAVFCDALPPVAVPSSAAGASSGSPSSGGAGWSGAGAAAWLRTSQPWDRGLGTRRRRCRGSRKCGREPGQGCESPPHAPSR